MLRWWFRKIGGRKRQTAEIHPDEILIDSENVPEFDRDRMEGRIERPISRRQFAIAGVVVMVMALGFLARAGDLQIVHGETYAEQAKNNQLAEQVIFADRGVIEDRNGVALAWNDRTNITDDFAARVYASVRGVAHAVGYVKAPAKDSSGFYYRDAFEGVDGAEQAFNTQLGGQNGLQLTETDARGTVVSQSTERPAEAGAKITLSIDARVSQGLYNVLADKASQAGFQGAAGVVMDVRTGELLALTSYPEYSPEAMIEGDKALIDSYNADKRQPFLDRATDGLYAPGSIVKPVMAAAGLTEGVITPSTLITSTGSISIPNPYDPEHPSVFKDWRVNGIMTVRDALAVSSDVFFYEVGGGFKSQPGIGIDNIDKYLKMFGYGADAGLAGFSSKAGTIPNQAWKALNFPEDPTWRIGDTYHTAIGQYGVQVTPLQAVREAATVANGGTLLTPTLISAASSTNQAKPTGIKIPIDSQILQIVREGMRQGVTTGIAVGVNFPFVHVAAKTGTAQIGMHNEYINAWMIGFWPYEDPKYAFAVVLERAPAHTSVGGVATMNQFFNWLHENAPEYLE